MDMLRQFVRRLSDLAVGIPLFLGAGTIVLLGTGGWCVFLLEPVILGLGVAFAGPGVLGFKVGLFILIWLIWLVGAPSIVALLMRRFGGPSQPLGPMFIGTSGLVAGLHPYLVSLIL